MFTSSTEIKCIIVIILASVKSSYRAKESLLADIAFLTYVVAILKHYACLEHKKYHKRLELKTVLIAFSNPCLIESARGKSLLDESF